MPSTSSPAGKSTFARAVDALCISRDDIAQALGLTAALLDAYLVGSAPVPAMTQLELVDVLKSHEALLGAVAGSLYEESMYRLERNTLDGDVGLDTNLALDPRHPGRRSDPS